MTAVPYAVILCLLWAVLQMLAVLRLPSDWSLWERLPSPAVSIPGIAAILATLAPLSEGHAATALLAPVLILYLAFLSFSWSTLGGS